MRTNDQFFQPGDKVVRVNGDTGQEVYDGPDIPSSCPQYGAVYCVEDFWEGPSCNVIMLVGFGGWRYARGMKVGWKATAFRKVEEIRLCAKAAQAMGEPTRVHEAPVTP